MTDPHCLVQKRFGRPRNTLTLTNKGVDLTVSTVLARRSFQYSYYEIDPLSSRQSTYRKVLFGAIWVFGGVCVVTAWLGSQLSNPEEKIAVLWCASFWLFLAIGAAIAFRLTRTNLLAYFSRSSGKALFTLDWASPNPAEFDAFIQALNSRLEAAHPPQRVAAETESTLATQLRELHTLVVEGVISETEFQLAKRKLLGMEQSRTSSYNFSLN